MKDWKEELKLAEKKICIECGKNEVPDFELKECCSGHECGCYGYPINVHECLCVECLSKMYEGSDIA